MRTKIRAFVKSYTFIFTRVLLRGEKRNGSRIASRNESRAAHSVLAVVSSESGVRFAPAIKSGSCTHIHICKRALGGGCASSRFEKAARFRTPLASPTWESAVQIPAVKIEITH